MKIKNKLDELEGELIDNAPIILALAAPLIAWLLAELLWWIL